MVCRNTDDVAELQEEAREEAVEKEKEEAVRWVRAGSRLFAL